MAMALDGTGYQHDDALLARFAAGDHSAARELTTRHAPRAMALARRMLRDEAEAEDVTQDAMLRVWKMAPDWRPGEAKLSTWIHRVTFNLSADRLRRRRSAPLEAAPEPVEDAPGAFAGLEAADRAAALRKAIEALPERQKRAVELRHFDELSNPEIAAALEVSVEAVESLLARGRRALARSLSPHRRRLGLD